MQMQVPAGQVPTETLLAGMQQQQQQDVRASKLREDALRVCMALPDAALDADFDRCSQGGGCCVCVCACMCVCKR